MNYKLAKQLKDAGFPQDDLTMDIDRFVQNELSSELRTTISAYEYEKRLDMCFIPTLSELIEACLGDFEIVIRIKDPWKRLYACASNLDIINGWYNTPEEAVANLYLKLNKKL